MTTILFFGNSLVPPRVTTPLFKIGNGSKLELTIIRKTMPAKTIQGSIEEKPVKRVLRHRSSAAYFKEGGWTQNPEEAHSFSDVVEAAEICARYGLSDVELALRYDAAATDLFCVPLR